MRRKLIVSLVVALGVGAGLIGIPATAEAGTVVGDYYVSDDLGILNADHDRQFGCSEGIIGVAAKGNGWGAIDGVSVRCSGNPLWSEWVGSGTGGDAFNDIPGVKTTQEYVDCVDKTRSIDGRVTGLKAINFDNNNSFDGNDGNDGIFSIKVVCSDGSVHEMKWYPGETASNTKSYADVCPLGTSVTQITANWGDNFGFYKSGGISGLKFECYLRTGGTVS